MSRKTIGVNVVVIEAGNGRMVTATDERGIDVVRHLTVTIKIVRDLNTLHCLTAPVLLVTNANALESSSCYLVILNVSFRLIILFSRT
jgi:hypothetical protein